MQYNQLVFIVLVIALPQIYAEQNLIGMYVYPY